MTIRKILVPAGTGEAARPPLDSALTVARAFGAHVEALHVRPDPQEAVPLLGEGVSGAMIEDLIALTEKEAAARAETARALFDAALAAHGVTEATSPATSGPSAAWHEMVGREDDLTVRRGRLSDLVVVGQPSAEGDGPSALTLNAALFESGRPVLVAPKTSPATIGKRIAVAWNASAEAARAVSAALPLLAAAEVVAVFSAATEVTPGEVSGDLVEFLGWHGIEAQVGVVPGDVRPVAAAILEACAADDIDLLVIGAYTHSRLRELILGGVTRHVLDRATVPMLMSH